MNRPLKLFSIILFSNIAWLSYFSGGHSSLTLIAPCFSTLMFYHIFLYRLPYLNKREVDSIYYLGFLITLSVLGFSAWAVANNIGSITSVGSQFALGLLATGYGLWARITLQSKIGEEGINDQASKYIENFGILNDRFNETVNLFSNLSEKIRESAEKTSHEASDRVLNAITASIDPMVSNLKDQIAEVNMVIDSVNHESIKDLSNEANSLNVSMASLGKALPSVSEALQTYSIQLASSTSSQNNFNEANEKLLHNFNALDQSIGTLQSSSSNVAKVLNENFTNIDLTNFNEFINQLSDSTKTIKNISDQAMQLSASIQDMHQTIGTGIIDSKESLMLQAKDLQEATELLNGAMIGLAKSMQAAAKEMTK